MEQNIDETWNIQYLGVDKVAQDLEGDIEMCSIYYIVLSKRDYNIFIYTNTWTP